MSSTCICGRVVVYRTS